ncbi:MAG: hypothetical protein WDZ28_05395 [Simkaniaceae bacterium]
MSELLKEAIETIGKKVQKSESLLAEFSDEDLDLLYSIAFSLYEQNDYKSSKEIFRQLVLAKPMERKNWLALAGALQMGRDYQEALTAWGISALYDDHDPLPHFHAAECLFSMENQEEGEKALSAAEARMEEENSDLSDKINALRRGWNSLI